MLHECLGVDRMNGYSLLTTVESSLCASLCNPLHMSIVHLCLTEVCDTLRGGRCRPAVLEY
jgi:hypothetical protein